MPKLTNLEDIAFFLEYKPVDETADETEEFQTEGKKGKNKGKGVKKKPGLCYTLYKPIAGSLN